MGDVDRGSGD